ncbi:Protein sat1 [Madurella mycetomatis]|uniref:Protein sat1 n=1 Tax=Madurella mycetomatis TaxID=100816 RepID=A0A175W8R2_9PEZI|nr:Protein sat1 [Madurella mycetomatis]
MPPDGHGSGSGNGNSNIRVFVRWHEQVVFAGEEVKCTITFKNVARLPGSSSALPTPTGLKPSAQFPTSSRHPSTERGPRQPSPLHPGAPGRSKPNSGLAPPPAARGHRSSHSLSVPSTASHARGGSISWSPSPAAGARSQRNGNGNGGGSGNGNGSGHGHKRSVSIVSIGSLNTVDDAQSNASSARPQRPARGHARASSLQILPRGGMFNGPRSAHPKTPSSQPSPLFHASYPPDRSINGRLPGTATVPDTPRVGFPRGPSLSVPEPLAAFKFPMTDSPSTPGTARGPADDDLTSPTQPAGFPNSLPVRPRDPVPTINEHGATLSARVLSTTSIAGTPRSSGEFYSLSNNSSETLASEYVMQQPLRAHGPPPHSRRPSNLSSSSVRLPESLMMGYAQIQGSFTLDGSLINLGPFEQVKRKAVVGGQGGGVVGLETAKRDSGLLRSFGWGNFTSSIGELLGGGELSSIKEMRGIASSKSIPLLSTSQSILFVDLQLAPGESRAFEYSFKLPKGLPPTHRGKVMKISYSLVIGTQRPGGAREQQIRSVDIPFRVLGSVNSHGEILGHDLMSPYILLRDQARVQAVKDGGHHTPTLQQKPKPLVSSGASSTMASFLSYVDDLLARPKHPNQPGHHSSAALLSPSATVPPSRRPSVYSTYSDDPSFPSPFLPASAKEAIDLAILRSNLSPPGHQSANRFEIARNGRRVGVVMLARPAYRLGEAVTLAIDFAGAEVPCYAVHAALETAEKVDPSLALRSEASVHRVTRKVWVSGSEVVMYARRAVFTPTIPATATPEFMTSGVGLEWKIRLEFVVPAGEQHLHQGGL